MTVLAETSALGSLLALAFFVFLIWVLVRFFAGIRTGYRHGHEATCPHCGHEGKPIRQFPVCEKCGRDRRTRPE